MAVDWRLFVDLVRSHQRFLLTTHIRPDGDALGSMLAMADGLERLGKSVRMLVASAVAPRYHFLDPHRRIEHWLPPGDGRIDVDLAMVLDTSAWGQLGNFAPVFKELKATKVVVDHHRTQDDLGAERFVDEKAEATGRLVYDARTALDVPLSPAAATYLYVALVMDTGWFRHSNTDGDTHRLVAKLIDAGARPDELYDLLFEQNSLGRLLLQSRVVARSQVLCDGRVAYVELHRDDYEATGSTPADSEDLVNFPRSIAGVEVGLFFAEQPRGGIKVSFRARGDVDVACVAEGFGGGGHRLAAGAVLAGTLDEVKTRVLAAVAAALPATP
jgi:phosphoesterase RecJ-like protein